MASHLDDNQLNHLRRAMQAIQGAPGDRVPRAALVELASAAPTDASLTIDFEAAAVLGQPLVVLRDTEKAGSDTIFDALSPREREVAALLADGLRNREIAAKLFISVATVKDHVHRILAKTGLKGRARVGARWRGM